MTPTAASKPASGLVRTVPPTQSRARHRRLRQGEHIRTFAERCGGVARDDLQVPIGVARLEGQPCSRDQPDLDLRPVALAACRNRAPVGTSVASMAQSTTTWPPFRTARPARAASTRMAPVPSADGPSVEQVSTTPPALAGADMVAERQTRQARFAARRLEHVDVAGRRVQQREMSVQWMSGSGVGAVPSSTR